MSDLLKHQFYILLITFFLSSCGENIENGKNLSHDAANSSILYKTDQYVGAHTCAECHEESHQKWMDSHHYHAMELPNEETVRADFNNSIFENFGVTSRFFRENEKFMVETENQEGNMEVFEVAYTFGWEPLQQYLVKFPDGRMQVLPTCWDVEKKEWRVIDAKWLHNWLVLFFSFNFLNFRPSTYIT